MQRLIIGSLLVTLASLTGCGGEQSVASKSAAAFREKQKKGETFAGDGHGAMTPGGGHEMPEAAPGASDGGHARMAEGEMASMDHAGMAEMAQGGKQGMAGMDHSRMAEEGKGSKPAAVQEGMAGMGHSAGGSGSAGHEMGGDMPADTAVAAPEPVSPGQPAETLRPDALDSPVATSVVDAQRSAEMAEGMAGLTGGGHGTHGAGTYRQLDAGRGPGAAEGSEGVPMHGETLPQRQHSPFPPPAAPPERQEGEQSHEPAGDERASGTTENTAAVYVCPMHPGVTRKTSGKCPKCGMTLVERRKG
ncbi:MAG TPA: hypothetical protein DD490_07205 [Acidobacteria bacterium]|nr:hypothetical protein [Acidobacteriota bacterium]